MLFFFSIFPFFEDYNTYTCNIYIVLRLTSLSTKPKNPYQYYANLAPSVYVLVLSRVSNIITNQI